MKKCSLLIRQVYKTKFNDVAFGDGLWVHSLAVTVVGAAAVVVVVAGEAFVVDTAAVAGAVVVAAVDDG